MDNEGIRKGKRRGEEEWLTEVREKKEDGTRKEKGMRTTEERREGDKN